MILSVALEVLAPVCPSCGRLAIRPPASFRDMTSQELLAAHVIECPCGVVFAARFYRVQW